MFIAGREGAPRKRSDNRFCTLIPVGVQRILIMSLGVQERHSQAFQSLASSTRSSSQGIDEFPV